MTDTTPPTAFEPDWEDLFAIVRRSDTVTFATEEVIAAYLRQLDEAGKVWVDREDVLPFAYPHNYSREQAYSAGRRVWATIREQGGRE